MDGAAPARSAAVVCGVRVYRVAQRSIYSSPIDGDLHRRGDGHATRGAHPADDDRGARGVCDHLAGDWRSAGALVAYALAFSLAYVRLGAGIGALLLFGAVQLTIVGSALAAGERAVRVEWWGLSLALTGLVYLVAPGLTAPPVLASMLMVSAGIAWGVYTVRGRRIDDPLRATTGNFVRATPLALAAGATAILVQGGAVLSSRGVLLAAVSGGVTSALGYVVWYQALRGLTAMRAAVVQLAVPVLTAFAATVFLDERITGRVVLAGAMILGGIGLTIVSRGRPRGGSR
jgi:drug/metabolite transporter (DMT)-like permease